MTLNDTTLITGELSAGATFVAKEAGDLPKLTKDDKLAAMVRDAGKGAKGIVVQARCR